MDDIVIEVKRVGELQSHEVDSFCRMLCDTYGEDEKIKEKFTKKYLKNIYGESIIVFARLNEKCVGIQAFLRNDIAGREAYQSGDSVVSEACRGKGIFSKMVKAGVKEIPLNALIYGFPNNNSYPAFMKMGWKCGERKKYCLFWKKMKGCVFEIDAHYFSWMTESFCDLYYCRKSGSYYILKKKKYNIYQVIGKMDDDENVVGKLKRAVLPILLIYSEEGKIGNGMITIWLNEEKKVEVPVYKMDTLLT